VQEENRAAERLVEKLGFEFMGQQELPDETVRLYRWTASAGVRESVK
jgi:RimJ/RimL family protein N-acetyltransferase